MNENAVVTLGKFEKFRQSVTSETAGNDFLSFKETAEEYVRPSIVKVKDHRLLEVVRQINSSYAVGNFDACAVMIRKLIEQLLIMSVKNAGKAAEIKDPEGNYKQIASIVKFASSCPEIDFTRNTKKYLDDIILIGHLSAHKPFYVAQQEDLDGVQFKLRVTIEELIAKSGAEHG